MFGGISLAKIQVIFIAVVTLLFLVACVNKPVDILVASDGTVLTGKLEKIESGKAYFSNGSVEVPDNGCIWCLNGNMFTGDIAASGGVFKSGSFSIPEDSVYMVVWGDGEIQQKTFAVDAAHGWQETGMELDEEEVLVLYGTGTVAMETGISTPHGQDKFSSSVALVPGATAGQLVFKAGTEGQPVAAGDFWIGKSPNSGALMLAVNVPLDGSTSPKGIYSITVKTATTRIQAGTTVFYPAGR